VIKIEIYNKIKNDEKIKTYINKADESLKLIGYTEHSFAHLGKVAEVSSFILKTLGYDEKTIETVKIASYLHDIGNLVNRIEHAQSGAIMAFKILTDMNIDADIIADVVTAIGNHDEGTANTLNPISAALILADKADVRRSRVRNQNNPDGFDIHDRVNYSVEKAIVEINKEKTNIILKLDIDTKYCAVMEYFEIFLERMILCRKAANVLNLTFNLIINGQQIL
jgi:metal-dependent HD superfamily phosphatase/phosphodiesterase